MTPKIPDGYTDAQYRAALKTVIEEGRAKIDKARQAARAHLESQTGSQVGSTEGRDTGGGHD